MKFKSVIPLPLPLPSNTAPYGATALEFLALAEDGTLVRLTSNELNCSSMTVTPIAIDDSRMPKAESPSYHRSTISSPRRI
jgi:hypothetical protein